MTPPDGAGPAGHRRRRRRRTSVVALSLSALAVVWASSHSSLDAVVAQAPAAADAPEATTTPEQAIEAPASRSQAARAAAKAVGSTSTVAVASTGGVGGIPSPALSAYQRAESVINAADPGCRVSWQLLAAIGSVESDHGRHDGAVLDDEGRARPAVLGPVLDGGQGTALIRDTDAGQYDGDAEHDRAVGPMQFIPSTWAVVGVDADDDGRRDPQDIDDAALAAAVYLCSGPDDLSTRPGQQAALHRYNHSGAYVAAVLSRTASYLDSAALDVLAGGTGGATTVSAGLSTGSLGMAPLAAVRTLQGLGSSEAVSPFFSDVAEALADSESGPGRPVTVAARLRGPEDGPGAGSGTTTADDEAAAAGAAGSDTTADGDAAATAKPGGSGGPSGSGGAGGSGGSDPAPSGDETTDPAVPAVPTSEEVAATIFCADLGLLDDPAAAADDFDVCVDEQLATDDDPSDPADPSDPTAPIDLTGLLTREDQG